MSAPVELSGRNAGLDRLWQAMQTAVAAHDLGAELVSRRAPAEQVFEAVLVMTDAMNAVCAAVRALDRLADSAAPAPGNPC